MAESWEKELVDGLIDASDKNFDLTDGDARHEAMENLAEPIAEAIKNGGSFNVKGTATVDEINSLQNMSEGDIWILQEGGELKNPNGSYIPVKLGDFVRFDGSGWNVIFSIPLDGFATKEDLKQVKVYVLAALSSEISSRMMSESSINSRIDTHVGDTDNPHNVTAEQIGAAKKDDVESLYETKDDAKTKAESYGVLMRSNGTNTLQFYRPSLG